jgi:hypothetical protein
MTDPLTDAELDDLERALADMTPGPWTTDRHDEEWAKCNDVSLYQEGDVFVANIGTPECLVFDGGLANGRGIALLRNLAPRLLAEVRRLREVEASCREIAGQVCAQNAFLKALYGDD